MGYLFTTTVPDFQCQTTVVLVDEEIINGNTSERKQNRTVYVKVGRNVTQRSYEIEIVTDGLCYLPRKIGRDFRTRNTRELETTMPTIVLLKADHGSLRRRQPGH